MRYLTLEMCKKHVYVEHDEDNDYIEQAAEAAEQAVENYLQSPLEDYADDSGAIPRAIIHGMLLFFGSLYASREAFTGFGVNTHPSILALLNPYKRYRL